jgi:hypothetical protein
MPSKSCARDAPTSSQESFGRILFGDDVDIPDPSDHGPHPAVIFAHQAFDPVAQNRFTDFAADRDTDS